MSDRSGKLADGLWLGQPPSFSHDGDVLELSTAERTDFWRHTHYGFVRDNGHFLGLPVADGFTCAVRVTAPFRELYDQAGLMLRLSAQLWVKAGVEVSDGALQLSTVVTRERSDWSVAAWPGAPPLGGLATLEVRMTWKDGTLRVDASPDGISWRLIRLADFPAFGSAHVGPMACTPERAGLAVRFDRFRLGPPIGTGIHDPG